MIYLASAYTASDPAIMDARYHAAARATAYYIRQGYPIFSPIVHCHSLPGMEGTRGDYAFYKPYCQALLRVAQELWVLQLEGWQASVGVTDEIASAHEWQIPVVLRRPPISDLGRTP